ncbi:adhesion G-protein coupled receptor G2-like [Melanotaenia boesemani]|uniref:adhesion G-protein coupled receptor G2-like n=1 Tax=Melanotaenia boesemani TaxID=1250792 RepID=UPI001C03FE52|nr:adhesion G-protein coupled receptor G2-like [Melanotaenia boesemani]
MKFWILWWLLPAFIFHGEALGHKCGKDLKKVSIMGPRENITRGLQDMEDLLDTANVSTLFKGGNYMAKVFNITPSSDYFDIYANEDQITTSPGLSNLMVMARLPKETLTGQFHQIAFCSFDLPNRTFFSENLYEGRLIGMKVAGRQLSGLQQRINITIYNFTISNELWNPQCVFLNYSTQAFSREGCETLWEPGWSNITCSCNHLTIFAVLLVSTSLLSVEDQQILKYISLVGCSLSLVTMIIAVLIFITNKQIRADDTKKVHISLVIALILLNVHFLSTETAAKTSSTELCFYVAISLHYYLLATFSWMLLEGFHLYLLVVKVFNIYIKRYMLKASVVGWGVPAVIVSVVVIIDTGAYGHVALDLSNPNSTKICYITKNTVKWVSTLGVFCLVFFFNMIIFVVIVKWVLSSQSSNQAGQSDRDKAKRNLCTLLSIMILLGVTWGLIFFSFGDLRTPGLYIFCIMNPLQGVFIFLYFVLSWKRIKDSTKTSTQSTS